MHKASSARGFALVRLNVCADGLDGIVFDVPASPHIANCRRKSWLGDMIDLHAPGDTSSLLPRDQLNISHGG